MPSIAAAMVSAPRARNSGTFSNMHQRGRSSALMRAISRQRPLRSPSRPLRRGEAPLMSWQGLPPEMMSTLHKFLAPTSRTSLCLFASGKCLSNIVLQNSDCSTCHTVSMDAHSNPKSNPPIPLKRDPWVNLRGRLS
jgi:hypothetical protein